MKTICLAKKITLYYILFIYYNLIIVFLIKKNNSSHFLKKNKIVFINYDVMYYNIFIILIRNKD